MCICSGLKRTLFQIYTFWILCFFSRFPQLQFEYRDPEKNFDRSKVHGLVAKLITVKDASTATALEVAAGGKVSRHPVNRVAHETVH